QRGELFEASNRLGKAGGFQRRKVFVHGLRGILETFSLSLGSRANRAGIKVEQVSEELVGMLSFDSKLGQGVAWKMLEVVGHDHVGSSTDRGGKNVTIFGI